MTASYDFNKFVLVMFKDLSLTGVHIPFLVRHLLETRTYIEWNEEEAAQRLFWAKLRRALHARQRPTTARLSLRDSPDNEEANGALLIFQET